jgi:hypothetical protein
MPRAGLAGKLSGGNPPPTSGWYVSNDGDDGNDGRSEDSPLKTLAALVASDISAGEVVYLERGGAWREALAGLPGPIEVHPYGAGARPVIDGRDVALNASFSKTGGYTNVYQISWAHSMTTSGGKTSHRAWEDGEMMLRAATVGTTLATALTLLDTLPGYMWSPPVTAGGPETIYIHPAGSTDPTSNGREYLLTKRDYAIQLYTQQDHARIFGLHGIGNGHADGSICIDGYAEDCLASDGRVHNFFFRGEIVDCEANGMEPNESVGGATLFVSHEHPGTGRQSIARRCLATCDGTMEHGNGASNADAAVGFLGHTNGVGDNFGLVYCEECEVENCNEGFSFSSVDVAVYYKCTVTNARNFFGTVPHEALVILGGSYFGRGVDGTLVGGGASAHDIPETTIVRGVRIYKTGGGLGPWYYDRTANSVEVSRCTVVSDTSGGIPYLIDGSPISFYENIVYGAANLLMLRYGVTGQASPPTLIAHSNVYYNAATPTSVSFQRQTTALDNYTLPQWKVATGQDANSVNGDPLFNGSPALGDFTVAANSPANALRAGADYDGEDDDAVLQGYLLQYAGGAL